jgi:chaperonin GroES
MPQISFIPLYDRLLVQKDEAKTVLAGGILIPEDSADKPETGTVVAAGHGRLLDSGQVVPMRVKAGDHILFHKYAGTEIKLEDKSFLIMTESEVFGVLQKPSEEIIAHV